MSCAPNERLLQTLRVHLPGATDAIISLELFNTVDEFFRRTSAWLFHQDITLEGDVLEYPIAIPPDSNIVRMIAVAHNGVPVAATSSSVSAAVSSLGALSPELTFEDGDATFKPAVTDLSVGLFSYAIYKPDFLTITSPPDESMVQYPMQVIAALSVSKSCLDKDCSGWSMPDWMHDMFFQDWLNGTLSRMYGMPSKPWSSEKHAVMHGKKFRNQLAYRKQEALRGFNYGVPMWRFPVGWA